MRLLLDVHHSPAAAVRLRQEGHDVLAAASEPHLTVLADEDLLRAASAQERVLVSENVKDFDRIVRAWAVSGDHHYGVVFTSPRRFHRGSLSYPENLIAGLRQLLASPPTDELDWVYWLG